MAAASTPTAQPARIVGSFDGLSLVLASVIGAGTITVTSLLVNPARRCEPDVVRPFRVPLYPLVPVAAIASYATMLGFIVLTQPALAGGAAMLLAIIAAVAWVGTRTGPIPFGRVRGVPAS